MISNTNTETKYKHFTEYILSSNVYHIRIENNDINLHHDENIVFIYLFILFEEWLQPCGLFVKRHTQLNKILRMVPDNIKQI